MNLSWKFLFLGLLWLFTTMKLIENLTHFSNNTSIHGLVHIAKKSSSKAKRITWFVIFILSMIYAGTQIAEEAKCKHLYLVDIQKLCWPIFALFWPPTYLMLTFVDIWTTTYLMSTLTFETLFPLPICTSFCPGDYVEEFHYVWNTEYDLIKIVIKKKLQLG